MEGEEEKRESPCMHGVMGMAGGDAGRGSRATSDPHPHPPGQPQRVHGDPPPPPAKKKMNSHHDTAVLAFHLLRYAADDLGLQLHHGLGRVRRQLHVRDERAVG